MPALQVKVTLDEAKVEPGGGLSMIAADPAGGVAVAVLVGVAVGEGDEGGGVGVAEELGAR